MPRGEKKEKKSFGLIFIISFFSVITTEPNENRLLQSMQVVLTVESGISRAWRVTSAAVGLAAASSIAVSTDLSYRTSKGLFIFNTAALQDCQ